MLKRLVWIAVISLLGVVPLFPAAAAETYVAELLPVEGTGAGAGGVATLILDDFESEIAFTIEYEGLSGPEIASHIHRSDGTIIFDLPAGSPKVGVWQNPGFVNVFLLRSEQLFILVHTEAHPGGEIRGDIRARIVALVGDSWGAVKALFEAE